MSKRGNPKPWVAKAEQDCAAAMMLVRKRKTPMSDIVCFHAQQCAEKYLKAFLVLHRIYFPKTHDLVELLNLAIHREPMLGLLKPFLTVLKPYAVTFRYPDEHATRAEARHAVNCMRRIRERMRQVLGLP